jgi:hypothetical protein
LFVRCDVHVPNKEIFVCNSDCVDCEVLAEAEETVEHKAINNIKRTEASTTIGEISGRGFYKRHQEKDDRSR